MGQQELDIQLVVVDPQDPHRPENNFKGIKYPALAKHKTKTKQLETEGKIVTDIREQGWCFKGVRIKPSIVVVYKQNNWSSGSESPEFRTE